MSKLGAHGSVSRNYEFFRRGERRRDGLTSLLGQQAKFLERYWECIREFELLCIKNNEM